MASSPSRTSVIRSWAVANISVSVIAACLALAVSAAAVANAAKLAPGSGRSSQDLRHLMLSAPFATRLLAVAIVAAGLAVLAAGVSSLFRSEAAAFAMSAGWLVILEPQATHVDLGRTTLAEWLPWTAARNSIVWRGQELSPLISVAVLACWALGTFVAGLLRFSRREV